MKAELIVAATLIALYTVFAPAASNQHLRGSEADPAEAVWHPKVPLRSDSEETYCVLWSQKVVYGVAAYLRASPDERTRALIISYQTGQEDKDNPEVVRSVQADDGAHAQLQIITDGHSEDGHWFLDEDVKRWAEDVFFFGWAWAGGHPVNDAQMHASTDSWVRAMHAVCMRNDQL